MARNFWLYGKKRGQRRSGSPTVGNAAVLGFLSCTLLVGLLVLGWMVWAFGIPQLQASTRYEKTTGVVLDKRVAQSATDEGPVYRPELLVAYEVDGRRYETWTYDAMGVFAPGRERSEKILARFETKREYRCWYDPSDPQRAVLVRVPSWPLGLMALLPLSFIVIGGGGLVYQLSYLGKSRERRAALSQLAGQLDPFDQTHVVDSEYPFVPNYRAIADSPGTRLAFRLPAERTEALAMLFGLAATLATNGMSVLFIYLTVQGHRRGDPDWLLTLFTVPVILGGVATLLYFVRRLLVVGTSGPLILEISDHPLFPGRRYRLYFSYGGQVRLRSLSMRLRCEERTTFLQGTNARSENTLVFDQVIMNDDELPKAKSGAFELECPLEIPAGAMHAFKADHNEIAWRVDIDAKLAGWPDLHRRYPLTICPADTRSSPDDTWRVGDHPTTRIDTEN